MTYDFLESLYNDVMMIARNVVIKRQDLADANETLDTRRSYEEYISCIKRERNIHNFVKLNPYILAKYIPKHLLGECIRDRRNIPEEYYDPIITDHIQYVIDNYEERNEYYRMLNGIPAKDDIDLLYIRGYAIIPEDVPIHKLSIDNIAYLETKGVLRKLQEKYPDKQYLRYLGIHKIDLIKARQAKPFQILRSGVSSNSYVDKHFEEEYHKARRYIMIDVYNKNLFVDAPLYEGMIGMLILCLAIRNTLIPTEKMYLNFEEILDSIFDSYGVLQYFENFPFTYKKKLVLMMDKLYQAKGTDGVMVDICKMFSNDNLQAKRYYFMKTYKKDLNGEFILKEDDPDATYNLQFLTTDVGVPATKIDSRHILDYDQVVNADYLWQMTAEETREFKKEEFNLMMSKYVSVEAVYDLNELTYEVCFFTNLLLSARNHIGGITVANKYSLSGVSDCFTMLIFMFALFARRAGYDGNLVFKPTHIAQLWRFNLEDMSDEIRYMIEDAELEELGHDIEKIFFDSSGMFKMQRPLTEMNANDCVKLYMNNRNIFDELCEAMRTTKSFEVYQLLSKIKKVLFVTCMNEENFKKADGSTAKTYLDLLIELDPSLYDRVMVDDEDDLNDTLLYVMEKMEYLFSHDVLQFLFVNTPNTSIELLSKYIRTTIEVFKASAVQLETINIFFNLGGRKNPIRVFDWLNDFKVHRLFIDQVNVRDKLIIDKLLFFEDIVRVSPKYYQYLNEDFNNEEDNQVDEQQNFSN